MVKWTLYNIMTRHSSPALQVSWAVIYWCELNIKQTISLPSCQKVKQAENGGWGQWLYLNWRCHFVLVEFHNMMRVIADPRLGQGENVLNNIKRIERGEQNSQTSFRILAHEKQQWNTNHSSSGNREGIVKCTRNGMTGRQGSEGKISNLNKASTVSAPTPHSQTSTFHSLTTLKSGGNAVSILAFCSAENSEAGCE